MHLVIKPIFNLCEAKESLLQRLRVWKNSVKAQAMNPARAMYAQALHMLRRAVAHMSGKIVFRVDIVKGAHQCITICFSDDGGSGYGGRDGIA